MNANNRMKGFTLIELMVTVAILALIAGIAIPVYKNYISTSRNVEAFNNMSSLHLAEEDYYLDNNKYVAGTYDGQAGVNTLQTHGLSWKPGEPDSKQNFSYTVATTASDTSIISITATGLGRKVPTSVLLTLE